MDFSNIVEQAKKVEKEMKEKQEELSNTKYFFESFGGSIKIAIRGNKKIDSIEVLNEELFEDSTTLLDMITKSLNDAIESVEEEYESIMEDISSSLNIPGVTL